MPPWARISAIHWVACEPNWVETRPRASRAERLVRWASADGTIERIAAAKAAQEPAARLKADGHRQAQLAWRMVIELVAGLMIGFGIGYGLDTLFGTMPVFLILFILAGFAAGLAHNLFAGKSEGDPDIKRAAQAFLPDVGFVIG